MLEEIKPCAWQAQSSRPQTGKEDDPQNVVLQVLRSLSEPQNWKLLRNLDRSCQCFSTGQFFGIIEADLSWIQKRGSSGSEHYSPWVLFVACQFCRDLLHTGLALDFRLLHWQFVTGIATGSTLLLAQWVCDVRGWKGCKIHLAMLSAETRIKTP